MKYVTWYQYQGIEWVAHVFDTLTEAYQCADDHAHLGGHVLPAEVPQCSKCVHWASRFDSAKEHEQLKDARPSEIAGLQRALDGKSNDPQYTMWGQCELGDEYKARSLDVKEPSQSLAFAECYDNDTWARLRTHATFGCLQFDPKTS